MRILSLPILLCLLVISCKNKDEGIIQFAPDDVEMNDAIEQAQTTVDEFIKALANPKPDHRHLLKIPLTEGEEVEHMWLEPVTFSDGVFTGILVNEPADLSNVKIGDSLECKPEKISDWVILRPDGSTEAGGYTIKVMEKQAGD